VKFFDAFQVGVHPSFVFLSWTPRSPPPDRFSWLELFCASPVFFETPLFLFLGCFPHLSFFSPFFQQARWKVSQSQVRRKPGFFFYCGSPFPPLFSLQPVRQIRDRPFPPPTRILPVSCCAIAHPKGLYSTSPLAPTGFCGRFFDLSTFVFLSPWGLARWLFFGLPVTQCLSAAFFLVFQQVLFFPTVPFFPPWGAHSATPLFFPFAFTGSFFFFFPRTAPFWSCC